MCRKRGSGGVQFLGSVIPAQLSPSDESHSCSAEISTLERLREGGCKVCV